MSGVARRTLTIPLKATGQPSTCSLEPSDGQNHSKGVCLISSFSLRSVGGEHGVTPQVTLALLLLLVERLPWTRFPYCSTPPFKITLLQHIIFAFKNNLYINKYPMSGSFVFRTPRSGGRGLAAQNVCVWGPSDNAIYSVLAEANTPRYLTSQIACAHLSDLSGI